MTAFEPSPLRLQIQPVPEHGIHSWLLSTANFLRHHHSPDECVRILEEATQNARRDVPGFEIEAAVAKAFSDRGLTPPKGASRVARTSGPRRQPLYKIEPEQRAIDSVSTEAPRLTLDEWRSWLAERSPKRPDRMSPGAVLLHLFEPGDCVAIITNQQRREPRHLELITSPHDTTTLDYLATGQPQGVWFLPQPITGKPVMVQGTNGEEHESWRSKGCVTSFRYVLLESDKLPAEDFLRVVVSLPVPIQSIATSGGRSIHVLVRVDCPTKAEWDAAVGPLKAALARIGCDPAALTAVRLSRLPLCRREEKNAVQELLFLANHRPLQTRRLLDACAQPTPTAFPPYAAHDDP